MEGCYVDQVTFTCLHGDWMQQAGEQQVSSDRCVKPLAWNGALTNCNLAHITSNKFTSYEQISNYSAATLSCVAVILDIS